MNKRVKDKIQNLDAKLYQINVSKNINQKFHSQCQTEHKQ